MVEKKEPYASKEEHEQRVIRYRETPLVNVSPGLNFHVVTMERMTAIFTNFAPNVVGHLHRHEPEQFMYILEGEGDQVLEGKRYHLKAGDVFIVPPNAEHGLRASEKGIRTIEVFSPPRRDYEAKLQEAKKALKK